MLIIYSDKIILPDKIFSGYIKIDKSVIQSIDSSITKEQEKYVLDLTGTYIMAGIINVNSDNIDTKDLLNYKKNTLINTLKLIEYSYASTGVTTLYHGVYLNSDNHTNEYQKNKYHHIMRNIKNYNDLDFSLIDNKLHLKFQIDSVSTIDEVKFLLDENILDLISYDLRPKYKSTRMYTEQYMHNFIQLKLGISEETADKIMSRIRKMKDESNVDELGYLIKYAHFAGIKVSTSEYNSANKIYEQFKDTTDIIKITENMDKNDIKSTMYYKLIDTYDLLSGMYYDIIDDKTIISSLHRPNELFIAYNALSERIPKYEISKLFSRNPAKALGLGNVGEIKEGYKADLIAFKDFDKENIVVSLIKDGIIKFDIKI